MPSGIYANIDVNLPNDPRMIDAGDLAELVYIRAVLHCRDQLTDGVIDRRLLARICVGIRGKPGTHAARLVDVGLWDTHRDGWCIPLDKWRRWNPTRAEVEAKRDAETERKRQWKERHRDNVATTSRTESVERRDGQTKTEPETEPEILNSHLQFTSLLARLPSWAEDDRKEAL